MKKIDGAHISTTNDNGDKVTDHMFTYSEEERQENTMNKENAKLVFNWSYLTIPREAFDFGLSGNDVILYSFIHSYCSRDSNRFYFTNIQLAEMFNISDVGVSRILKRLSELNIIKLSYRRKANGGQIRFVSIPPTYQKFKYQLNKSLSSNLTKRQGNNNKINNNKINTSETSVSQDSKSNVNAILDIFFEYNPTINYANKTYRKAIEKLLSVIGEEKLIFYVRSAFKIHGEQYAPVITNPVQLQDKLLQLKNYLEKNNQEITSIDDDIELKKKREAIMSCGKCKDGFIETSTGMARCSCLLT